LKKQSKRSSRSGDDANDNYSSQRKQQQSSDREKMLERRKSQVSGVRLCSCGGVLWQLGDVEKCGDCRQIKE